MPGDHGDRKVLEGLLFKKMVSIAASLQDEKDPRNIAEDFELIEKGLRLIDIPEADIKKGQRKESRIKKKRRKKRKEKKAIKDKERRSA